MDKILNFINGKFSKPIGGKYLNNINPATGEVYGLIPDSDAADVNQAVDAARNAFNLWSKTSVDERIRILKSIALGISSELENLARAESIDTGKPISLSRRVDIPRSQKNFEFFADELKVLHDEKFETNKNAVSDVTYSPLGPVACISPWNLPLYLLTWKIAPALAAGCTVVAKPSEVTPMTAFLLSRIFEKASLPAGVVNIVHGTGPRVGAALVSHTDIKAVTFTGSTITGRSIASASSSQFKKMALEMGGKNPNIIFSDCDFEKAISTTVRSSFENQGQICLCGSRIFIERGIYNRFRDELIKRVNDLKLGDPLDENTTQGALVSSSQMDKVLSYIDIGKKEGRVLTGGERVQMGGKFSNGYFVKPTLVEGLDFTHKLNQEEIFGPVATLIPFDNIDELIKMANSTRYGLSASIWTQDLLKASNLAKLLDAGTIWINTWMLRDLRVPFGGVKESGVGREGGIEALKFFSEVKTICTETVGV
jgi:aminomuconate-semialdehyde/2-hydroxymuconate-6-semialdehyde dehydrogenase